MIRALLVTWAFAGAVTLLNIGGLWPLTLPLGLIFFWKWHAFLMLPLICGSVVGLLVLVRWRDALSVNLAFWLTFFVSAEIWRDYLMKTKALEGALCIEHHSFIRSLTFARGSGVHDIHAATVLDDRVLLWSYREMGWYEVGPRILHHHGVIECSDAVQAFLEDKKDD